MIPHGSAHLSHEVGLDTPGMQKSQRLQDNRTYINTMELSSSSSIHRPVRSQVHGGWEAGISRRTPSQVSISQREVFSLP